jgi:hypothetical protein
MKPKNLVSTNGINESIYVKNSGGMMGVVVGRSNHDVLVGEPTAPQSGQAVIQCE